MICPLELNLDMGNNFYEFLNPVKIISGNNALEHLLYELKHIKSVKPFIITDKGIKEAKLLSNIENALANSDIQFIYYDEVPQDSSLKTVQQATLKYRKTESDSIIAVGGGSVIDTAKAVNILISEESNNLLEFEGAEILENSLKPLIVIPTTVGTGSEATGVAVIKDTERNIKIAVNSPYLVPKVAILDPKMTQTLPLFILASTAMDALTHAIESYTCLQKNPVSDAFSIAAIELISQNLIEAIKFPKTDAYIFNLANAAFLAGVALSNSIAGVVHSLGHATGSLAKLPHGVVMSIFLPYGLEYNLDKISSSLGKLLLPLAGEKFYFTTSEEERAGKVISYIKSIRDQLYTLVKLPRTLKEAGVNQNLIVEIAKIAINDGSIAFNPVEVEYNDALSILEKAYE